MPQLNQQNLLFKIESQLKLILNPDQNDLSVLWEAMQYSVLAGGKRIRSLLTIAAGKLSKANDSNLLILGAAIELIHCYSLIHDDLPAMDNDDLRRGLPTCHKKYNEAVAILAGDALQALAFAVLSDDNFNIFADKKLKIINMLANYIGVNGMAGGQNIDLLSGGASLNLAQLQKMHNMKTGCLIKGSILSGYLCGGEFDADIYQKLSLIADKVGLLFQVVDDILDVTSSTEELGKTANKDFLQQKATYVSILGMDNAQKAADELHQQIILCLEEIPLSSDLMELTDSIYQRNN